MTGAGPRPDPPRGPGRCVIAHDWGDARRREPLTLRGRPRRVHAPPLDTVRFDLDLKIAGREDEIAAALADRGLMERAMVSTMEVGSVSYLRDAAPELDRGWTLPKVSRDWSRSPWLRPIFLAGSASLRARLPGLVRSRAPDLGVWAVWVFHPLITQRLVDAAHSVGVVSDRLDGRRRRPGSRASRRWASTGSCTNDPRLFSAAAPRMTAHARTRKHKKMSAA